MKREEVKVFLEGQLKKLREAHVADLMKVRRHKELEEILEDVELDFSPIKEFWDEETEAVYQPEEEISKEFLYELACFMQSSDLPDYAYFEDYEDYQKRLWELEEEVADNIADAMDEGHLCDSTLAEMLGC